MTGSPADAAAWAAQALGVSRALLCSHGWTAVLQDPSALKAQVQQCLEDPPLWLRQEWVRQKAHHTRQEALHSHRQGLEARQLVVEEALMRAVRDGGRTDAWTARILHAVGIREVLVDGQRVTITRAR